jgi:hypothetical protein
MSRSRTATNVLQLRGAFAKNPNRAREDARTGRPLGDAPIQEPITFQQAWDYIASCAPSGTLDERDRLYVEVAAALFVEFRLNPFTMHPQRLGRLEMMMSKLGMTPVDSSRVSAPKKDGQNEFAD